MNKILTLMLVAGSFASLDAALRPPSTAAKYVRVMPIILDDDSPLVLPAGMRPSPRSFIPLRLVPTSGPVINLAAAAGAALKEAQSAETVHLERVTRALRNVDATPEGVCALRYVLKLLNESPAYNRDNRENINKLLDFAQEVANRASGLGFSPELVKEAMELSAYLTEMYGATLGDAATYPHYFNEENSF